MQHRHAMCRTLPSVPNAPNTGRVLTEDATGCEKTRWETRRKARTLQERELFWVWRQWCARWRRRMSRRVGEVRIKKRKKRKRKKKCLLKIINLAGICHGTPATQRGSRESEQWSQWPAANCLWKAHQPLIDFCWSDTCLRAGTKGRCEHLTAARRPRAPLLPRDEWPWARRKRRVGA